MGVDFRAIEIKKIGKTAHKTQESEERSLVSVKGANKRRYPQELKRRRWRDDFPPRHEKGRLFLYLDEVKGGLVLL